MKALLCIYNNEDKTILSQILRLARIDVITTDNLQQALEEWSQRPADLLIITLLATEVRGTIHSVRATTDVPTIVITDPLSEEECLFLYEEGADLVVLRPYSHRLLKAQAERLLKRGLSIPLTQLNPIRASFFALEPRTRILTKSDGQEISLTEREFQLLDYLWRNRGQVLTNEQIIDAIWGYTGKGDKNVLRSLVNRLRHKLEPDTKKPRHLITIPGIGYKLVDG